MCQRLSHTEQKQGQQAPMKPECWARLLLAMGLLVTVPSQPPYILCFKLWLLSFLVRRSLRSIWLLGVGLDGQDEVTWAQDTAGWQISLKLLRSMNFTRGVYVLPFVLLDVLVAIGDRVTEPPPCANLLSSYSHASCPADVRQPLPFKQQVTVWS